MSDYYRGNNFQDSSKTFGLSPNKYFFFNAFKLGMIVWEDAHIGNMNWSKREHQEANSKHI